MKLTNRFLYISLFSFLLFFNSIAISFADGPERVVFTINEYKEIINKINLFMKDKGYSDLFIYNYEYMSVDQLHRQDVLTALQQLIGQDEKAKHVLLFLAVRNHDTELCATLKNNGAKIINIRLSSLVEPGNYLLGAFSSGDIDLIKLIFDFDIYFQKEEMETFFLTNDLSYEGYFTPEMIDYFISKDIPIQKLLRRSICSIFPMEAGLAQLPDNASDEAIQEETQRNESSIAISENLISSYLNARYFDKSTPPSIYCLGYIHDHFNIDIYNSVLKAYDIFEHAKDIEDELNRNRPSEIEDSYIKDSEGDDESMDGDSELADLDEPMMEGEELDSNEYPTEFDILGHFHDAIKVSRKFSGKSSNELDQETDETSGYGEATIKGAESAEVDDGLTDLMRAVLENDPILVIQVFSDCYNKPFDPVMDVLLTHANEPSKIEKEKYKEATLLELEKVCAKIDEQEPINNNSALTFAVENGSIEIVKILLAKGANTSLRTSSDETALGIAARNNNIELVGLLLNAGASEFEDATIAALDKRSAYYSIVNGADEDMQKIISSSTNDLNRIVDLIINTVNNKIIELESKILALVNRLKELK